MNQHLQNILNIIQQAQHIDDEEKAALIKAAKDADKELAITTFKLDRTEKVKRTTSILLEETIEELENKRKAVEAQNRELEIEASLERVRTMAMSMNKPDDLLSICETIYHELEKSGFDDLCNAMINIHYDEKNYLLNYDYAESSGKTVTHFAYNSHPIVDNIVAHARQSNETFTEMVYAGKALDELRAFRKNNGEADHIRLDAIEALYYYFYSTGTGAVGISMFKAAKAEQLNILERFRNVFDLAYKRYIDITNAEAQAREAQIEASLERVRSRSLAMRKSDELKEAGEILWNELGKLGIPSLSSGYVIMDKDGKIGWIYAPNPVTGKIADPVGVDHTKTKEMRAVLSAWKKREPTSIVEMNEEETIAHQTFIAEEAVLMDGSVSKWITAEQLIALSPKRLSLQNFNFTEGSLMIVGSNKLTYEQTELMLRFTRVFQQTYTRFLDLQKAEAQARESQIQLALERVRARTMAMQKSEELSETAFILLKQFQELGENPFQITIGIFNEENKAIEFRITGFDGSKIEQHFDKQIDKSTLLQKFYKAWKEQQSSTIIELKGKELMDWIRYLRTVAGDLNPAIEIAIDDRRFISAAFFSKGLISFSKPEPIRNETVRILERFAGVFDQTYTRFLDLKKAEEQVREAQIEAALERVRSKTMAMQKSDELAETAAVLFQQLIHLGIEPNRLYISIIKDDEGNSEFWITDEDGTKVSTAFHANMHNNTSFKKMFDGWKAKKESLIIDMHDEELQEYFKHLGNLHVPFKGGLIQKRRLQYISYFSKGFIGMASPDEQPQETVGLLNRFAYVFNLTFTRFNDLKVAEAHALQAEQDLIEIKAARKKAEEALTELQATQKQLVQSEKMASLGELTAGIAHEIQNPLNFVNNFSEVSNEMIDEMKEELATGNLQLATEIADDIKQNLEKINHHGRRADAIVKGMLQHSRKSEGIKEPTDINALCDEYLRLSYHGLRAKDKSFNADFKTDFDESFGKINVVPQDTGRVLLNLFNNAFYTVNERCKEEVRRQKAESSTYVPTVTVVTKKLNNKIEIRVSDNGNGIPQNIVDKIFQPFFTTKPTGSGTGLGLSLSYDIIKAHSGEIKVETKEGEGSRFIIQLPQ